MGSEDVLPPRRSRVAELTGEKGKLKSSSSSASLSEKLPGEDGQFDERAIKKDVKSEIKMFGDELKAGVSTISGFWKEFKDYIESGGIIDNSLSMAAGQAFSELMNSFVADLLLPIFVTLIGRPNAKHFFLILKSGRNVNAQYKSIREAKQDGASVLPYGRFLQKALNFIFLGFSFLFFVRVTRSLLFLHQKRLKVKAEGSREVMEKDCIYCCMKVSVNARRCPHCTSMLNSAEHKADSVKTPDLTEDERVKL